MTLRQYNTMAVWGCNKWNPGACAKMWVVVTLIFVSGGAPVSGDGGRQAHGVAVTKV